MTDKKPTQKQIDQYCEELCDQLEAENALHAKIIRGIFRDKVPLVGLRRLTGGMSEQAIAQQRGHAMRTLVEIVTGGALSSWSTPVERRLATP